MAENNETGLAAALANTNERVGGIAEAAANTNQVLVQHLTTHGGQSVGEENAGVRMTLAPDREQYILERDRKVTDRWVIDAPPAHTVEEHHVPTTGGMRLVDQPAAPAAVDNTTRQGVSDAGAHLISRHAVDIKIAAIKWTAVVVAVVAVAAILAQALR